MRSRFLTCTLMLLSAAPNAGAASLTLSEPQLTQRDLLIYQSGQTLVSETYTLPTPLTVNTLLIPGINPQYQPGSAVVRGIGTLHSLSLITQQPGLQQRLERQIGQLLSLKRYTSDGQPQYREARLLGIEGNQLLLQDGERTEYLPLQGEWQPLLPGLEPTGQLPQLQLHRSGQAESALKLHYLAGGLAWQVDYNLTLHEPRNRLTLAAQATISNHSGQALPASDVRLLAGTVNQPQDTPRLYAIQAMAEMKADTLPTESAFEDYHLYSLPEPLTLPNGSSVTTPLFSPLALAYSNHYRFMLPLYGNAQPEPVRTHPQRTLRFELPSDATQKAPLPAGAARVYVDDSSAGFSFIGGQRLESHAAGEAVELVIGEAFDLTLEQTQTDYARQGNTTLLGYRIAVRNAGTQPRQVELLADFNQNWELTQANVAPEALGSRARWQLEVPADGETLLSFNVQLSRR